MLKQSRIAVIVFRHDENQTVSARHSGAEAVVLQRFAGIIMGKIQLENVDKLRLDVFTLLELAKNELGNVFTRAAFPRGAEDYGNEEWFGVHVCLPGETIDD